MRSTGERYDFVITADQQVGAYWMQVRGLGECGTKRAMQLAVLRYARGPYQPTTQQPTYDVGLPQGVVSNTHIVILHKISLQYVFQEVTFGPIKVYVKQTFSKLGRGLWPFMFKSKRMVYGHYFSSLLYDTLVEKFKKGRTSGN